MFSVKLLSAAAADLSNIDKVPAQRIVNKLSWLAKNLDLVSPLPLKGDLAGFFKLRIGDWRVIYQVDYDIEEITVHQIGHRKEIYDI